MYSPKGVLRSLYRGKTACSWQKSRRQRRQWGIIVTQHERAGGEKYRSPSRVRGLKRVSRYKNRGVRGSVCVEK